MVVVRNQEDYKLNRFIFQLGGASVDTHMDRKIYWSMLCRTGEPTEAQIKAVQEKVMNLLENMVLGQWQIANTQIQKSWPGAEREYMICINAVPVLNRIPAVYGQENAAQSEDYVGAYALTQATFLMSANGDVINVEIDSPIEVKAVLNENMATLSFDELVERAQQHLSFSDCGELRRVGGHGIHVREGKARTNHLLCGHRQDGIRPEQSVGKGYYR